MSQLEALERQIEKVTNKGRAEAIEKIRALIAEIGVTMSDLDGEGRRGSRAANAEEAKQRGRNRGRKWQGSITREHR